jgi:hypothetical protein
VLVTGIYALNSVRFSNKLIVDPFHGLHQELYPSQIIIHEEGSVQTLAVDVFLAAMKVVQRFEHGIVPEDHLDYPTIHLNSLRQSMFISPSSLSGERSTSLLL